MIRDELMSDAHIGSRATYLACLHDLAAWNLITYQPSRSQHRPSRALMHELTELYSDTEQEQDEFSAMPKSEQSPEHSGGQSSEQVVSRAAGPILKTIKNTENESNSLTFSNHDDAAGQKKISKVSLSASLLTEPLLEQSSTRPNPKEKVAPKRKAPSASTRPGPKPEILFTESELADPEAFAAAFAGTDFALANLLYYHEKVANWRKDGEPPRRRDWKSTSKNFMLNDIERNALVLAPTARRSSSHHSGQPGFGVPDADEYVSQRYS
jgi:hypothetical protein